MATYSYAQLEGLWIQNGGSPAAAPMAAAIAEAESGGRSDVTSPNPDGGTNVGPWQIDTNGVGKGLTVTQLQDPDVNASAAVQGSKNGTNWSDWQTYANGAYKAFLSTSTTPDTGGLPITNAAGAASAATPSGAGTPCVLAWPTLNLVVTSVGGGCLITKSAARGLIGGLCVGAAGIIGIAGLIILATSAFTQTGAGKAVAQAGEAVVPAARVASVVTSGARKGASQPRKKPAASRQASVPASS